MIVYVYRPDAPNQGLYEKQGTTTPSYSIDFTAGIATAAITISACTANAVNASNTNVTSVVVSGVTTTGALANVVLLSCGTSGAAATNTAQFRVRTQVTLSTGGVLYYDTFIYIDAPTYGPGGL